MAKKGGSGMLTTTAPFRNWPPSLNVWKIPYGNASCIPQYRACSPQSCVTYLYQCVGPQESVSLRNGGGGGRREGQQ